jgi:hypothetical protein
MNSKLFTALAGGLTILAATPTLAQVAIPSGLVVVNLSNIKLDVAKNINVDVSQIPVTVQAPIDVAAIVCGVSVGVLSDQSKTGTPTCTAKTDTSAINTIVQNQIKSTTAG